jgi:RNA polymerase sigma-70 factor (ECF subfamily)
MVVRYCRGRLGVQECAIVSAEDVAQEVCFAVLSALPGYRVKNGSFRSFVYGIAAHKVTDAYRAAGRNHSEPMAQLPDAAATSDGPELQAIRAELAHKLNALLNTLTVHQREVLVLRVIDGLSAAESAEIVGSTEGAVRVIQHRALDKLRSTLSDPRTAAARAASEAIGHRHW